MKWSIYKENKERITSKTDGIIYPKSKMEEFISKYWLEVLFGLVIAECTSLYAKLKAKKKENRSLKNAICALLRDRIIVIYNRYTEKEYFPIHERENLQHLTSEYYALGGNGIVKELEAKLSVLPTEKPPSE